MQDIISQRYEFNITPLQINSKTNITLDGNKKSITIKLGQSIGKCNQIGSCIRLLSQVLYSKINNKFCPIKGIIKIYDVVDQQNQIILCIGTFQAQEILQQKKGKHVITKNIGNITLKMEMSATKISNKLTIQSKNDNKIQSIQISDTSSQNLMQQLDGSQKFINEQKMQEQLKKYGGVRRVSTLNLGLAYYKNDIVDLKSGINFGFSPPNNHKNFIKINSTEHGTQNKQLANTGISNKLKTLAPSEISAKIKQMSLFINDNKQDSIIDSDSLTDSNLIQMKQDKYQHTINLQSKLDCPPSLLSLKKGAIEQNSNIKQQYKNFQQMIDHQFIKSMKISQKYTDNKQISTLINFKKDLNNKQSRFDLNNKQSRVNLRKTEQNNPTPVTFQNNIPDLTNSMVSVTTSIFSYPQILQQYQKNEIQTLGQLLVQERRKNLELQQKNQKLQFKISSLKQKYTDLLKDWKKWCENGLNFLQNMQKDGLGNYFLQINRQKGVISIKYNINENSQQIFSKFLSLTIENCSNYSQTIQFNKTCSINKQIAPNAKNRMQDKNNQLNSPTLQHALQKINFTCTKNNQLIKLYQKQQVHLHEVQNELRKTQYTIKILNNQKQKITQQSKYLKSQIQYFQGQIKSLTEINSYLKQKDWQLQSIITLKQGTIENMKKIMQDQNQQLDQLEQQIENWKKSVQNKQLMLQQMRQQLADKQQIIQIYKQTYGETKKSYKSRQTLNSAIFLGVQSILQKNQQIGQAQ